LGLGSKWNVLYAWHRYSNEDPATGERTPNDVLKAFVPYIQWVKENRNFLGDLSPAPAKIAILKPVRSDVIGFWRRHDPRFGRRSHTRGGVHLARSSAV
jgi:hypothetical protein